MSNFPQRSAGKINVSNSFVPHFLAIGFSTRKQKSRYMRHFCLAEVFLLGGAFVPTGTFECQKLLNFLSNLFVRRLWPRAWGTRRAFYTPSALHESMRSDKKVH